MRQGGSGRLLCPAATAATALVLAWTGGGAGSAAVIAVPPPGLRPQASMISSARTYTRRFRRVDT